MKKQLFILVILTVALAFMLGYTVKKNIEIIKPIVEYTEHATVQKIEGGDVYTKNYRVPMEIAFFTNEKVELGDKIILKFDKNNNIIEMERIK